MSNILRTKPKFSKSWLALIVGGVLLGSIATNRIDDFFNTHVISYQTPIVLQTPMIVKPKLVSPIMVRVYATPAASPETETAAPTATPVAKKVQLLP